MFNCIKRSGQDEQVVLAPVEGFSAQGGVNGHSALSVDGGASLQRLWVDDVPGGEDVGR